MLLCIQLSAEQSILLLEIFERVVRAVTGGELDLVSPLPPDLEAFWNSRPD